MRKAERTKRNSIEQTKHKMLNVLFVFVEIHLGRMLSKLRHAKRELQKLSSVLGIHIVSAS